MKTLTQRTSNMRAALGLESAERWPHSLRALLNDRVSQGASHAMNSLR